MIMMKRTLSLFGLFLILPWYLQAGVTGKLAGTVIEAESGNPLVGANVIVQGTDFGAATDESGSFVILNIPPGDYTVQCNYIGYETQLQENVRIMVDLTTRITFNMQSGSLTGEQITVTAESPMIQKDLTSSMSVVRQDEIEALPISEFTQALSMQAGVVGEGSSLNIRGGRSNEVAYLIDGMYVQDPLLGGLATNINNDAIQEMSLLSGTFNAEYGNALSGVVNIVTREGGKKYGGRVEVRTSQFGVDRYADLEEFRTNGSLSGPLYFNWLRFFVSGELNKRGSYLPFGYRNNFSGFGKLTYSGLSNIKMNLMYRTSNGDRQGYSHSWKYIPDRYLYRETSSDQLALTMTHTISNSFFYDFRFSSFYQTYYSGVGKDTSEYMAWNEGEYLPDAGNGNEFYSNADPPEMTDSETRTNDFRLDFVWQIGERNEVKFGSEYKDHMVKLFYVYDPKRDNPYINDYRSKPFELAGYLQDKIEFPYLVINLGLRYDYLNANAEFRNNPLDSSSVTSVKPRTQISPRIGIAHPVSDRTKLHFSYGHFFQNPEFQYLYENQQYDLGVREPLFGQANLDAERTIAYEVGLSHQFTDRIALDVTAYYKDVTGLIGTRYYPAFSDDAPDRYVGYTLYVNEDYANIKGFEINLDARPGKYFGGGLSYTYSVAKGSASSETEQYPGTTESTRLYYLNFDKPHVFNASGTFTLNKNEGPMLFGAHILQNTDYSFIIRASSGYPYTPSGRDIGFVERNSLRRPATYSIDVEIGKEFLIGKNARIRAFAEILNLTDHRNILYVYPDTGDPDYTIVGDHSEEYMQDPSNYGPPRSIRLGVGFQF